MLAIFFVYFIY